MKSAAMDIGHIEESLKEPFMSYRLMVDHGQDGAFVCQHGVLRYVNETLADMLGYRAGEMVGLRVTSLFIQDRDHLLRPLHQEQETGQPFTCETQLLHRDCKTVIPVSMRVSQVPSSEAVLFAATLRRLDRLSDDQQLILDAARKYRAMFENAVVGMYQSTPEGRLLDANQALAKLLGYDSVELLLQELSHIREIYAVPDSRGEFLTELDRAGRMTAREAQWKTRDGRLIWVLENARVIYGLDGRANVYEGTVQEITARKLAEERLQNSEKRYRALADSSHIGVYLSVKGCCVYANRALAQLVGWSEAELVGMTYREFYAPECLAAADERLARRERGDVAPMLVEAVLMHRDGETRVPVTVYIGTFEQDGVLYTCGTVLDITERKQAEKQLVYNATHDQLTGLPNRGRLLECLGKAIARAQGAGNFDYAVLFLDIDEFKFINDSFGHAQGDVLLVEVARRLQRCLRHGDVIARHGGDEFTVLLENMDSSEDAIIVTGRIEAALGEPILLASGEAFIHASIGITFGKRDYSVPEQVLRDADIAMYRAKSSGKACHVVFDSEMHDSVRRRMSVETDLRMALERDEFRAHYQPICDLRDGSLLGFEALLRWDHKSRGLLLPDAFLDVAEETGLILPISWWMLEQAAMQLGQWRSRHPWARNLTVSVNIANRQFSSSFLIDQVKAALEASQLPPEALCLEITESVFIRDPERAIARLNELKGLGVGLHLDDFGTGFSSLSYLSTYPVDVLKVDRLFIMGAKDNSRREHVLRNITQLARDLGIHAIAEGIETPEQVSMLRHFGFQYGQGFLLGRAMDAAGAAEYAEHVKTAPGWRSWLKPFVGLVASWRSSAGVADGD